MDFGLWLLDLGYVDVPGFGYVLVVVVNVGCGLGLLSGVLFVGLCDAFGL